MSPDKLPYTDSNKLFIDELVTAFYRKAVVDTFLAYQFQKIKDFDQHFERILKFWYIHILHLDRSLRDEINELQVVQSLIPKHARLKIKRGELHRWLLLFRQTIAEAKARGTSDDQEKILDKFLQKLIHFEDRFESEFFPSPA